MKKNIILTIFMFLALTAQPALAQLFLESGKLKLSVNPSETITNTILIHNTSDQPMKIRVYWQDFEYVAPFDATKKFLPPGGIKNSASSWVNFTPREFVLPAFGKQEVSYVINVPPVIQGGYYGVLFFEKEAQESPDMRGLNIVTRVGCLFFIESADKKKEADLEDVAFEGTQVSSMFVNKGDVVLIPVGVFYIMDAEGNAVDRGEINNVYVPAQAKADYKFKIKDGLASGRYTIVVTMDLDEGDVLVKEIDFESNGSGQFDVLDIR